MSPFWNWDVLAHYLVHSCDSDFKKTISKFMKEEGVYNRKWRVLLTYSHIGKFSFIYSPSPLFPLSRNERSFWNKKTIWPMSKSTALCYTRLLHRSNVSFLKTARTGSSALIGDAIHWFYYNCLHVVHGWLTTFSIYCFHSEANPM